MKALALAIFALPGFLAGCRGPAPPPPPAAEPPPATNLKQGIERAATDGDTAAVEKLLSQGAGLESVNESGRTPLAVAAIKGHTKLVKSLLERGAYVNARDREMMTPLMWAAFGGRTDVVELLLRHGADVKARDVRGKTALDWAPREASETRRILAVALRPASGPGLR